MKTEVRTCQNCKSEFSVEPEDLDFYGRISVPSPTFCPSCRMVRRFQWRNERTLYKTTCRATGKNVITMFSPESDVIVYERDRWWSDEWDQLATGREYDFSRPFFSQFADLLRTAPLPSLANTNVVESEYGNHNADMKNCYLTFASFQNENTHYSSGVVKCRDSMDLYMGGSSEQCYNNVFCEAVNRVSFSYDTDDSTHSLFLHSCKNLTDCLGCVNLRNRSHCIFNEQYSKEEYQKKIDELDLGSYRNLERFRSEYEEFIMKYPRRFASIIKSVDCTGDNIMNSKNCHFCFDLYGNTADSKYVSHFVDGKDCYDIYGGGGNAELMYEGIDTGLDASKCLFTVYTHGCQDIAYCYICHFSSNLFGCVGLHNKKYCILNRQYTKHEYESLLPKIIGHMNDMQYEDGNGRTYGWGELFPPELSPFAYNETIAQEYSPLTQAEIESKGYRWKKPEVRDYEITLPAASLPDHIKDVKDELVDEVIGCAHGGSCTHQCTKAFKITGEELTFYRTMNLPIPRLCSNCRHYARLSLRPPFMLWQGKCMCHGTLSGAYRNSATHSHGEDPCPNEFQTPYAPDRPEIIYCEQCYQAEVI